jgi:alcohol dehydrogenase class IV
MGDPATGTAPAPVSGTTPIVGEIMPHIAITTTLSAAEFTPGFGVTDRVRRAKDAYLSPSLAPRAVILDPELALDTPSWLWGSTGIRAVDHAVESLCSIAPQPFADALAPRALEILVKALPQAVKDPADVTARGPCQIAMWMSAYLLFIVPQGMSHAIGHQLVARCGLPHGVCSASMLPVVMDYSREVTAPRQALVAEAMGVDVTGMSVDEAAAVASDCVRDLVQSVGIKARLRDWGITTDDLPGVADAAVGDHMIVTNPRPITGSETVLAFLYQAF